MENVIHKNTDTTNKGNLQSKKTTQPAYISVMLIQLCLVSGTYIFAKLGAEEIPVISLAVMRFLISASVLFISCLVAKKLRMIERKDIGMLLLLAFLLIPVNQLLFLFGQRSAATTHGALIYALTPIFIAIFAWIYLREKISRIRLLGIALGVCGALYVISGSQTHFSREAFFGDILIVIAMISWALFTVVGKPFITKYGTLLSSAAVQVTGIVMISPMIPSSYNELVVKYQENGIALIGWLSLGYLALITSVVAYLLWYWALARSSAVQTGVWMSLQPIVATIYSYLAFGNKELTLYFFVGGAIATIGVIITQTGKRQPNSSVS